MLYRSLATVQGYRVLFCRIDKCLESTSGTTGLNDSINSIPLQRVSSSPKSTSPKDTGTSPKNGTPRPLLARSSSERPPLAGSPRDEGAGAGGDIAVPAQKRKKWHLGQALDLCDEEWVDDIARFR